MSAENERSLGQRTRAAGLALIFGLIMGVLVWPLVGLLSSWLRLPRSFEPMALGLILIMIAAGVIVGWTFDSAALERMGHRPSDPDDHR